MIGQPLQYDLITDSMSEMKAVQPFPVFCDHYQISPHNLSSKA